MEKKKPSVFAGRVSKNAGNNKNVSYSNQEEKQESQESNNIKYEKNINQKINEIFNSSNYIYKADVEITFKDKKSIKRIVGRNTTHLITIENELIPITDVIDIKVK